MSINIARYVAGGPGYPIGRGSDGCLLRPLCYYARA
jgi:hypothetical protein